MSFINHLATSRNISGAQLVKTTFDDPNCTRFQHLPTSSTHPQVAALRGPRSLANRGAKRYAHGAWQPRMTHGISAEKTWQRSIWNQLELPSANVIDPRLFLQQWAEEFFGPGKSALRQGVRRPRDDISSMSWKMKSTCSVFSIWSFNSLLLNIAILVNRSYIYIYNS